MIFIDASRYSNTLQKTGVENYSFFLINELIKLTPKNITLIAPKKIDLPVPQIIIPFPRLWTQIRLSLKILTERKIKNLFIPSHVMPVIHPENTTITIHDVAFKRFPESYGKLSRAYLDWGTKFAVKHAKNIITPSETTKKDLIRFYKADPKKIHVIPLGIAPKAKDPIPEGLKNTILNKYNIRKQKYFLFIGRIENKKNIQTLLKAFKEFQKDNPDICLVLAGKPGRGFKTICTDALQCVSTGYITNKEKQILLENALCLIFPSLYEGFGIPLLEAMQAGIPIIASKIPTSYEIARNNALFFKTNDHATLTGQMKKIAKDENLRKKLTKEHKNTLKSYSWKKCAKETLKILGG